jgi:hypothetical protein
MKTTLIFKFIIIFLSITGAVALLSLSFSDLYFGQSNFWHDRGLFTGSIFLFFIAFFPRLTLIVSSVPFGGFLWWLGWLFAPRILVACLATLAYWRQNPILVVISWLIAIGGESSEKFYIGKKGRSSYREAKIPNTEDAIETEYRKL